MSETSATPQLDPAPPAAVRADLDSVATPAQAAAILDELILHPVGADAGASDEGFWNQVRRLFATDREMLNLNNGGVSPSPVTVLAALNRHLAHANLAPAYVLWQVLEPRKEEIRRRLAALCDCQAEEIALTRNASEALEICQFGMRLEPGDEILTTRHDYDRMLTTWSQRERRDRVVVRKFDLPLPENGVGPTDDEIVALFEQHLTPRTRLLHISHVVYLTGQIMPVRRIVELARSHDLPTFVDGAHAFAQLPVTFAELGCDIYGASLHKWLCGPHGTGLLYMRRDWIPHFWPLMAAPEAMTADIRKFEEVGTHAAAPQLAVHEALDLHIALGARRKLARLTYLRDRWASRLSAQPRIRMLTDLAPGRAGGFASFRVEGMDSTELAARLWAKHRILVTSFTHIGFDAIRVTPSFYTTVGEVDRFCAAVEQELAG
jgi:isopenicillin-N epimerase